MKTKAGPMTESEFLGPLIAAENILIPEAYDDEDQSAMMELIDSYHDECADPD